MTRIAPRLAALAAAFAVLTAWTPAPVRAVSVSVEPSFVGVNSGDAFDLTVHVAGLGDAGPSSLGLYDLVVNYDTALAQFQSASFGSELGTGSVQYASVTSPGVLRLFEMSVSEAAALEASQPGGFTLATLTFTAVGTGTASFAPDVRGLYDARGEMLASSGTGVTSSAPVVDGGAGGGDTKMPEPSAALLFPVGLALVALRRRVLG